MKILFYCCKCKKEFEFHKDAKISYEGVYCPECWQKELDIVQKELKNKSKEEKWKKDQKLFGKFKPYFNNSLGRMIESREDIRQLEKNGTIFMEPNEYVRESKKIKQEMQKKESKQLNNQINSMLNEVKYGRSFVREMREKGEI